MRSIPGSGNYLVDMWEEDAQNWCKDCGCTRCVCDDLVDEELMKRKGFKE